MLLRLILENFLSFDEPVQFDMFPNMKRTTLSEHIYQQNIPILKQTAIYGANGAGKSNLIKGFGFIHGFISDKDFISGNPNKQGIDLKRYIFQLKKNNTKPLSLLIEFNSDDNYFIYSIEISLKKVEKEALYISGTENSEATMIFERKGDSVTFEKNTSDEVAAAIQGLIKKNPFSSLLSLNKEFPIFNDERVNSAYRWLTKKFEVVTIDSRVPILIDLLRKNNKMMDFTKKVFSEIGLGINSLKVNSQNFNAWVNANITDKKKVPNQMVLNSLKPGESLTKFENERQIYAIGVEKGVQMIYQFLFEQMGKDGFTGEMDIRSQSDGTVRLLTLVPAVYDSMSQGKTVIIDEIDHSIHPCLIKNLVEYFAKEQTNGQLIFTTHETCLLDQHFMRSDEIWFAEKDEGATQLYSLNDFKPHHSISIRNGYIEGRYGAIPFIGDLV